MQNQIQEQKYPQILSHVLCRFPLSFICFAMFVVINIFFNHNIIFDNSTSLGSIEQKNLNFLFASLGSFFMIVRIIQETKNLSTLTTNIINCIGFSFLFLFYFLQKNSDSFNLMSDLLFISAILYLILGVSPYLNLKKDDDYSVWFFIRKFVIIAFMCGLISTLLWFSLSTASWTVEKLFQLSIPSNLYYDIWVVSNFVSIIYYLSNIPPDFSFGIEDCKRSKAIEFIINWISVPVFFLYALILYAYFLKIILLSDSSYVINRDLVQLITVFLSVSILTFWSSFPYRETGKVHVRLFHKIFIFVVTLPVCINLYLIVQNINLVGFTLSWYALLIFSIWFLFVIITCGILKHSIKYIILSLGVCVYWAGLSPWSLKNVVVGGKDKLEKMIIKPEQQHQQRDRSYFRKKPK